MGGQTPRNATTIGQRGVPGLYVLGALAMALMFGGCTLQFPEATECATDSDCSDVFGIGSRCVESGYCTTPGPVVGCERTWPRDLFENPEAYTDRIVVGALYDSNEALFTEDAVELAVRDANEGGGVSGRMFAVVQCDKYQPDASREQQQETLVRQARYLRDSLGVVAIVGPNTSGEARTVLSEVAEVPFVSPSATSTELSRIDTGNGTDEQPGRFWRTVPADTLQAKVLADIVEREGVNSVAVLFEEGAYGDDLSRIFSLEYDGLSTFYPFETSAELAAAVSSIATTDLDGILVIASTTELLSRFVEAAVATPSLRSFYVGLPLFATDAARVDQLLENATAEAALLFEEMIGTAPYTDRSTELYNSFAAGFRAEYLREADVSAFVAQAYDAAWMIMLSVARAEVRGLTLSSLNIANGFRHLSAGREVQARPESWDDALESYAVADSINLEGVSSALTFDDRTEELSVPIEVWTVVDREFQTVEVVQD